MRNAQGHSRKQYTLTYVCRHAYPQESASFMMEASRVSDTVKLAEPLALH